MSCRVLGRKVEHMVLREILEHARAAGIRKLRGTYKPTDRNKLVVDHYAKLGFTRSPKSEHRADPLGPVNAVAGTRLALN
jgi:predicted enzyme involved in methoxymalonyl-ACP biosynthesis